MIQSDDVIRSEAMYGAKTKQALVTITLGEKKVTVSAADARQFALDLLDVVHAADGDAFLVEWLQEKVGVDQNVATTALVEFRNHRIRKNGER